MSPIKMRIADIADFLKVTDQRAAQMYREGKLPQPHEVDAVGRPHWKPATIERWAEREWWDTRRWRKPPT